MIRIFDDLQQLSYAAAEFICEASKKNISEKGSFSIVLSGGQTPRTTYEMLAGKFFRDQVDWKRVKIFFSDERYVSYDDERSNFKMVNETLLQHVLIPAENIFPIPTNSSPAEDALEYETTLRKNFLMPFPDFDFALLGMGENGHTASLFPYTDVLQEKTKWVKEVFVKELKKFRITLTAPAINASKQIVFLVSGQGKSQTLYRVLKERKNAQELPAQLIRGDITWMTDREAASLLIE
jgi:6-phosphogluconolactonase